MCGWGSWKESRDNGKTYLVKCLKGGDVVIKVSDLTVLWKGRFSEVELQHIFSRLNPLIEDEDGASMVPKVLTLLKEHFEGKGGEIRFITQEDFLHLNFKTKLEGIPLKFEVTLCKQPPEAFHEELLDPLFQGVNELLTRQEVLFKLLEEKDREIEEYKLEGGVITRESIRTKPFIREDFVSKSHVSCKSTNVQCFLSVFDNLSNLSSPVTEVEQSSQILQLCKEEAPQVLSEVADLSSVKEDFPTPPDNNEIKRENKPNKKKRTLLNL